MRRFLVPLMFAAGIVAALPLQARAQCDIPLVIGSAGTVANVLLIIDSSGSMNEIVFHSAYNPNTNYSGNFNRNSMYSVSSDAYYTPRSFNSKWPSTPQAYLVDSDSGEDGQYDGNYLNWVYFYATSAQRAAIPTYTKIQGAKQVVNQVLSDVSNVRWAVEQFNGSTGGTIIANMGTPVSTIQSTVNGIHADSWTPLAESAVTALNYYSQTGVGAPIQADCQKSFVVLITDGMPTLDAGVPSYLRSNDCGGNDATTNCTSLNTGYSNSYDCTGYLDNVTCYMYRNDLRPDLDGIQNVATFVIGFNVTGQFLQTAANEGGGDFFTANDADGLIDVLTQTLNTINRRVAAGASVAVVTAEDRTNNRLFRARYETGSWNGYVEAFDLPYQSGRPPLWEAGSILASRNQSTRTIYTSTNGTSFMDFTTGNAASLRTSLGAADNTEASNIIRYVRGDTVSGYRDRGGWKLGDVIDAAPLAVGKPSNFNNLPGYAAFRSANASRPEVLLVGSNDGMMHCFSTSNGDELWAYVPKSQLPRVRNLTDPSYCHNYFVNVTPAVYDVYIGSTWKTVVFGGVESSNNAMFAIDITNPTSPSLLWDVTISGLKGSWNPPTLVRDRTVNGHVLVVGTGFSSASSADSLIAINVGTGAVLSRRQLGSAVAANKTTRATAMDLDFDGWDDYLYLGDLAGRLFRVNLAPNPWTTTTIFNASEPIQAAPVVTQNTYGRPMIFFGTGQFMVASDPANTAQRTIYGVVDDGTSTTYTPANLVNQTTTINAITSSSKGWYVRLGNGSGERVTRNAALINGTLYVPSYKPSTAVCNDGGQSWLYTLDFKDGSAPDNANGTANNVTTGRSQSMGDGMLSDPTVDLVNEVLLLQSSNAVVMSQSIPGGLKKLVVRGWHQKWN